MDLFTGRKIQACRLQILNNWSDKMVSEPDGYLFELEYFCDAQSELWNRSDDSILLQAAKDLRQAQLLNIKGGFTKSFVKRIEKAYPVYSGAYYQLQEIRDWVDEITNLICVGRNGQHHYNNVDHSMETAFVAADSILENGKKKERVWNVNNSPLYHEKEYRV